MMRRFAAASMVASAAIGVGAVFVLATPGLEPQRLYPLAFMWCVLPLAWGIWAMFAPQSWVPERLPWWGAILGVVAGVFGALVLNLPERILGVSYPLGGRAIALVAVALFYYLLWHLVRTAWLALADGSR